MKSLNSWESELLSSACCKLKRRVVESNLYRVELVVWNFWILKQGIKVVQARAERKRQREAMLNATVELAWKTSDYHIIVEEENDAMFNHYEDIIYFMLWSARFVIPAVNDAQHSQRGILERPQSKLSVDQQLRSRQCQLSYRALRCVIIMFLSCVIMWKNANVDLLDQQLQLFRYLHLISSTWILKTRRRSTSSSSSNERTSLLILTNDCLRRSNDRTWWSFPNSKRWIKHSLICTLRDNIINAIRR